MKEQELDYFTVRWLHVSRTRLSNREVSQNVLCSGLISQHRIVLPSVSLHPWNSHHSCLSSCLIPIHLVQSPNPLRPFPNDSTAFSSFTRISMQLAASHNLYHTQFYSLTAMYTFCILSQAIK